MDTRDRSSRLTEPCDLSATAARALIGAKRLSPVELTQSCIRRIEEVDPAVNAMVARDFDGALAAARVAEAQVMRGDPLGALHGLPLGVKDLIDAAGLPTTYGQPDLQGSDRQTRTKAWSPRYARQAPIVIGKTNTPEWGAGGNTRNAVYGATGNPFDPTRRRPARRADRARRSPAAWCRSRPDPTPAAPAAIRRPSAASSAFGRRRA